MNWEPKHLQAQAEGLGSVAFFSHADITNQKQSLDGRSAFTSKRYLLPCLHAQTDCLEP